MFRIDFNGNKLGTTILTKDIVLKALNGRDSNELTSIGIYNIATIDKYAFENYSNLQLAHKLENVTLVEEGAFKNTALTCFSAIQNMHIKNYTFYNTHITRIYNLDKIISIGDSAFEGCTNFPSSISLPNCKTIGKYAFKDCIQLTSVNAPACEFVDYNAFEGCPHIFGVQPNSNN